MKNKIMLSGLIILLLSQLACASLPTTIKFATEATYPPFESITPSGEIIGFDIAIAKALCQEMQVQCTFTHQPFDSLLLSLHLGKFDAIIAAMAITPERSQQVDFSQPYYQNTLSFAINSKTTFNISPLGLKNKVIGVQAGTTFAQYLTTKYPNIIKVNTYASEESAFLDLEAGRVDAVMGDTPLIKQWLKEHADKKYQLVHNSITEKDFYAQSVDGIAVKKGNLELLTALNKALATIKTNGIYNKIKRQYLLE